VGVYGVMYKPQHAIFSTSQSVSGGTSLLGGVSVGFDGAKGRGEVECQVRSGLGEGG